MMNGHLIHQHLAVSGNDGEEVVEVVCHGAGEPADTLELLGLAKLIFQVLPFRHIKRYTDEPDWSAL